MITFIRMKRKEWKVKLMFYSAVLSLVENQKDIIGYVNRLYAATKDVTADELRKELINAVAELAHEEARKNKSE